MAARPASPQRPLDSFDRAILRIVQRDARTPQRAIADAVNLSAAAVQRRIAAMEASGVIRGNVALVDPKSIPLTITSIVEVYLQDERAETVQSAKARFQSEPEVQQCYYVTGGTSFILIVVTTDMAAYQALTQRLFEENDSINRFRSLIALERVKTDAALIIP
ncbi:MULTISPECIES: Lrp/AsnC family transcriptional regulator [unclassified Brevundimonas]|uniref:Lrp/AsnC family transcriptional regulator n=1 Tax=unclassified Brevundimonas TaxID=2622653 RepID=UPI000CFAE410|nr:MULTISPECIES: Lrp/AsnC family transcriptional regulator [unclassified Brevundimonas]PRA25061.1 AsnC family transcriptional regulator [Brevundimonas sp. MYb27]PQZ81125.1 AsnC family transcriptional regulator [Brevundimonas sp. MYb31]PRB15308.1 AsnC family transcriptional regulator [Brevundimonas sp. MYb52]PRB33156.1 AsnC family transcriptional regulator [Brevundimonas sp. MYb46]PRB43267.1 AsnC family transcriptional regulator [Brevundimonas sp. MYb33]